MYRLLILLMASILTTACHNDDDVAFQTQYKSSNVVVYDPFLHNPRYQLALFRLEQWRTSPHDSHTTLSVTNTSGLYATFNFIVSGPGWRYTNAVISLPPNATVAFGIVTYNYGALDTFWVTVPDVYYEVPAASG